MKEFEEEAEKTITLWEISFTEKSLSKQERAGLKSDIATALRSAYAKGMQRAAEIAEKKCPDCAEIKKLGTYRCYSCEIAEAIREEAKAFNQGAS